MTEMLNSAKKIYENQMIDTICSKVYGRQNYMIALHNGKIFFYGCKGEFLKNYPTSLPLSIAAKRNYLYFTYKKDWLAALKKLGINLGGAN